MPINYALYQNNLTSDPNAFIARARVTGSADRAAIVRRMVQQGSTTTEGDIAAVMEDMGKAIQALLLEGYRVNIGICEFYLRISGRFNGPTDSFDSSRHQVGVVATAGRRLRNAVRRNATVRKVETVLPAPSPLAFVDLASGQTDGAITPGSIGTVNGSRLKFDPTRPDEGIYLVPADAGPAIRVDSVERNRPRQLVFLVPAGLSGDYTLEVRARVRGGAELRTGRLEARLRA